MMLTWVLRIMTCCLFLNVALGSHISTYPDSDATSLTSADGQKTAEPTTNTGQTESDAGVPIGIIVGAVAGVVVVIAVIIVAVVLCRRRHREPESSGYSSKAATVSTSSRVSGEQNKEEDAEPYCVNVNTAPLKSTPNNASSNGYLDLYASPNKATNVRGGADHSRLQQKVEDFGYITYNACFGATDDDGDDDDDDQQARSRSKKAVNVRAGEKHSALQEDEFELKDFGYSTAKNVSLGKDDVDITQNSVSSKDSVHTKDSVHCTYSVPIKASMLTKESLETQQERAGNDYGYSLARNESNKSTSNRINSSDPSSNATNHHSIEDVNNDYEYLFPRDGIPDNSNVKMATNNGNIKNVNNDYRYLFPRNGIPDKNTKSGDENSTVIVSSSRTIDDYGYSKADETFTEKNTNRTNNTDPSVNAHENVYEYLFPRDGAPSKEAKSGDENRTDIVSSSRTVDDYGYSKADDISDDVNTYRRNKADQLVNATNNGNDYEYLFPRDGAPSKKAKSSEEHHTDIVSSTRTSDDYGYSQAEDISNEDITRGTHSSGPSHKATNHDSIEHFDGSGYLLPRGERPSNTHAKHRAGPSVIATNNDTDYEYLFPRDNVLSKDTRSSNQKRPEFVPSKSSPKHTKEGDDEYSVVNKYQSSANGTCNSMNNGILSPEGTYSFAGSETKDVYSKLHENVRNVNNPYDSLSHVNASQNAGTHPQDPAQNLHPANQESPYSLAKPIPDESTNGNGGSQKEELKLVLVVSCESRTESNLSEKNKESTVRGENEDDNKIRCGQDNGNVAIKTESDNISNPVRFYLGDDDND